MDECIYHILFDITDSGRGFEPFRSELGPAIVKKVMEASGGLFGGLFGKKNERKVRLSVSGLRFKDCTASGADSLLAVEIDGKRYSTKDLPAEVTFRRESKGSGDTTVKFLVNTAGIIDFKPDGNPAMDFVLTVEDPSSKDKDKQIFREKIEAYFSIEPPKNEPRVGFISREDEIEYRCTGDRAPRIADLVVRLAQTLECAPKVDLKLDIKLYDEEGTEFPGVLFLEDESGARVQSLDLCGLKARSENGRIQPAAKYAVVMDMAAMSNPRKAKTNLRIEGVASYRYSGTKDRYMPVKVMGADLTLRRYKQDTEMAVDVSCRWGGTPAKPVFTVDDIASGCSAPLPMMHYRRSDVYGAISYPATVTLRNKSADTTSGGRLLIRDITLNTFSSSGLVPLIFNKAGQTLPLDSLVRLEGVPAAASTPQGLSIPNGVGSQASFRVVFDPSKIYQTSNVQDYTLHLTSSVSFDYCEDTDGSESAGWNRYTLNIDWSAYQDPNMEWLSIDYGSSAIVCCYGVARANNVIDLSTARKRVLDNGAFAPGENTDDSEAKTKFLPSNLLFNDVRGDVEKSALCSQLQGLTPPYSQMALMLAPTGGTVMRNVVRQLPSLKVLMGNERLPYNPNYNKFKYTYLDASGRKTSVEAGNVEDQSLSLLRIDNIFREAYHILFRYFIANSEIPRTQAANNTVPDLIRDVNQVVLTYPNSYTPRNLEVLGQIVRDLFEDARTVKFVSESDAVAAYYMSHWKEYHTDTDDIKAPENILVYDMGAGTLDLTYIRKTYDQATHRFTLEILGKIGTGKAGNYLDHLVASILGDIFLGDPKMKRFITVDAKESGSAQLEGRCDLKRIVRDKLKPLLDKNGKVTVGGALGALITDETHDKVDGFQIEAIRNHQDFKKFLDDVSTRLLDLLAGISDSAINVDTVIMSGRSLRLSLIRDALSSALKGKNCRFIMLDQIVSGQLAGTPNDRSKTAVAEGAKIYVETYAHPDSEVVIRNKRINASYGVAYDSIGGTWSYHQLLTRADSPYTSDGNRPFVPKRGEVELSGLASASEIRFVQTYLSEEATRQAISRGDYEFVTIVETVAVSPLRMSGMITGDKCRFNVTVSDNDNVSLEINGLPTPGVQVQRVDLRDEVTKRSLWPMLIE